MALERLKGQVMQGLEGHGAQGGGKPLEALRRGPLICMLKRWLKDFLGGPVVKTPCSHCRVYGFNPWLGNLAKKKKKKRWFGELQKNEKWKSVN